MNKWFKTILITSVSIAGVWTLLTLWVEYPGPERTWDIGNSNSLNKVLIVYDPDPIFNLDEQVCRSFGQALADHGMQVRIATVRAAKELKDQPSTLYVFCANTYNWRPDWSITNFIDKHIALKDRTVVAITLGSGSTTASQKALEKLIRSNGGNLLNSRSLWLLRPNDESRLKDSNTKVSVSIAYAWGEEIAERITHSN